METLLRLIPLGVESLLGANGFSRHLPRNGSVVSTAGESVQVKESSAPAVAKPLPGKNGFSKLEAKAASLGIKMAQQGFAYADNPYAGLNTRLEAVWLSSFGKYHAAITKIG